MKKVMISSTAIDLPEHRKEVLEACLRQGVFPLMMEHLTAADTNAQTTSLALVDEAQIYLGIFGHRYGYVPESNNPEGISITEMEYNRAVENGIPRLIFLMDREHPLTARDLTEDTNDQVEAGRRKLKLDELTSRVGQDRVIGAFKSPMELRALVIQALHGHQDNVQMTYRFESKIPVPPKEYVPHLYTLLQTTGLIGRQKELKLLTDWVATPDAEIYGKHLLNFVAIGGTGKSALTWHWFREIAPQEMKPLAGRMWWSFYERDSTFENFVTHALAYVANRPLGEVQQIPAPDREAQLLAALDREPFLMVLDGLERLLMAYAGADSARLDDSVVGNPGNLRKTIDPRVGRFLQKLAQVQNSRILISTRLYPVALETDGGDPVPGSHRENLGGLSDEDAVELARVLGVSGSRADLLTIFHSIGNHSLLVQALAGAIKRDHRANGDFEEWRKANPRFDPMQVPNLRDRMAHVLAYTLGDLGQKARDVLCILAAFRMPTGYDAVAALVIGDGKACADAAGLDRILWDLDDRGLIGWDRQANRYDLHPIVRGVVWGGLSESTQRALESEVENFEFDDDGEENQIEREAVQLLFSGQFELARERFIELIALNPTIEERILEEFGFVYSANDETTPGLERTREQTDAFDWRWRVWKVLAARNPLTSVVAETSFTVANPTIEGTDESPTVSKILPHNAQITSEAKGEILEQAVERLFRSFFELGEEVPWKKIRKQKRGTQGGYDISVEWSGKFDVASGQQIRCHIECKNYRDQITLDDVAGKLLNESQRNSVIEHWILISPRSNPSNELNRFLEEQHKEGRFPFDVQIWSPETGIDEFFGLEPDVYDHFYSTIAEKPHPRTWDERRRGEVRAKWLARLKPPMRLPPGWTEYVLDARKLCSPPEDAVELDSIFSAHVAMNCRNTAGALLEKPLTFYVEKWLEGNENAVLLLLGEFGDGKSFFTYSLARRLMEKWLENRQAGWLPVRLMLRKFSVNDWRSFRLMLADGRRWGKIIVGWSYWTVLTKCRLGWIPTR